MADLGAYTTRKKQIQWLIAIWFLLAGATFKIPGLILVGILVGASIIVQVETNNLLALRLKQPWYALGGMPVPAPTGTPLPMPEGWVVKTAPGVQLAPGYEAVVAAEVENHKEADVIVFDQVSGRRSAVMLAGWDPELAEQGFGFGGVYVAKHSLVEDHDFASGLRALAAANAKGVRAESVLKVTGEFPVPGPSKTREVQGEPLVSIIIPTRDKVEVLRVAIESIRSVTAYSHYEIVVVDNGSVEEETQAFFDEQEGAFRVVRDEASFNFARLCNLGRAQAKGEILVLLNNDVEIFDPEWLGVLVANCQRPEVGVVGARLFYPTGTIQHAGIVLAEAHCTHFQMGYPGWAKGYGYWLEVQRQVSAVTAACLAVRTDVWDQVGGMDEDLPVTGNDVDFCLKVADQGLRVIFAPACQLVHNESVSRGRDLGPEGYQRLQEEHRALKAKWAGRFEQDPHFPPRLKAESVLPEYR